jgi:citronellol/citronellal dehydrogenase
MREHLRRLKEAVPLKRLALEAEISAVIVFLLSPAAAFVNGVTVQIDGGASLGNAVFPLAPAARQQPFEAFHRAVMPEVLKP